MGEWATSFEKIIFSFFLRYEVLTISNAMNGFQSSSTVHELNELVRILYNFSENGIIYLYHHICGDLLRRASTLKNFAYLKPFDNNNIDISPNTIRAILNEEY